MQRRQHVVDDEPKKARLIGKNAAEVIEMSYWLVKFVRDFEKIRDQAFGATKRNDDDDDSGKQEPFHWFADNSATIIGMSRFLAKFINAFEKLFNSSN